MIKSIFSFLFIFTVFHHSQACELLSNIALKNMDEGYTFIKSYRIDNRLSERKKVEYTCVFSKGTYYQITLAEKPYFKASQLKVSVLNSENEVILTNEADDNLLNKLSFHINQTGIYYLRFQLTENVRTCAAAVLGFYRFCLQPNQHYKALLKIKPNTILPKCKVWIGQTDQNSRLRLFCRYRNKEWWEEMDVTNLTDQTVSYELTKRIKQRYPKLDFRLTFKRIDHD